MRLAAGTAARLPPEVMRPAYDRETQAVGIVHLGLGAFHRAHQALYTDDAMAGGDRDWSICGVSLRSAAVRDELAPQDGLYTVTARSGRGDSIRLVGALRRCLVAPEDPGAVVAALAAPATRIVTLTVTEKGYCWRADGSLDVDARDVAAELPVGSVPRTVYGFLAAALEARRAAGLPGLTLLCCDNLAQNGERLARLLGSFLERRDPALQRWVERECAFPSTMVDRIVPAATPHALAQLEARIGLRDAAGVATEPFSQWVIENRFAGPRPRWEAGGAQFVDDVRAYEAAKLRMLNGAHSALAYLGLARGHVFVHEAVADPVIRPVVERLMRDEAAPGLDAEPGQDLQAYACALLARFDNPALEHRLAQIAMDGSQKIPQRWLPTLAAAQRRGLRCPAILEALAAWLLHLRDGGDLVDDPAAAALRRIWAEHGQEGIVRALFGAGGRFADAWLATPEDEADLVRVIARRPA